MAAITPARSTPVQPAAPELPPQPAPPDGTRRVLPVAAICAVQAVLSLYLAASNTAFGDEAEYLWMGRILLAHWLHGASEPPHLVKLSGSAVLYPPLGALASNVAGLTGARILSLAFMLGATILLYFTASRLIGRTAALFAATLWALSEPVLRLAFATFDPMSVFLMALSAWLVAQAGFRRRWIWPAAGAAVALALSNAVAYSGIVIDPVVLAFAFVTWLPRLGNRRAVLSAAGLGGGLALAFAAAMEVTGSWNGIESIFARTSHDQQPYTLVITDIWKYSGFLVVLAMIGTAAALAAKDTSRRLLLMLGCAAFAVPAAQVKFHTAWSLDKHLAYGVWFAAIAAGYGLSVLVRRLPGAGRGLAVLCAVLAFAYPAVNSWMAAWSVYHAWPNATSFVTALRPAVAGTSGLVDPTGQLYVAEYYLPQGSQWDRWYTAGLSLHPPAATARAYYTSVLNSRKYGVIALFYAAASPTPRMTAASMSASQRASIYQQLISSPGLAPGESGLGTLTGLLERSRQYRLVAAGPYDSASVDGTYAIWQRVPAARRTPVVSKARGT
jgi:hypothetical protein